MVQKCVFKDITADCLAAALTFPSLHADSQKMTAAFFREVTEQSIWDVEFENPFATMKIFELLGVESRPITLEDVPQKFRPYKGCIFVRARGTKPYLYPH